MKYSIDLSRRFLWI